MVIEESLSKVGSWQQCYFDVFQDLQEEVTWVLHRFPWYYIYILNLI
jgi:hypothetical protein